MNERTKRWGRGVATALVLGVVMLLVWQRYGVKREDGLASGNGRIEATEIDVAAKIPGRIKEVLAREGDFVTAGQVVALMDTDTLEAQLHEAQAQLDRARSAAATARSQLAQRQAEKAAAQAVVQQREAELNVAQTHLRRSMNLVPKGAASAQQVDDDRARVQSAEAAIAAARAQVAAAEAAIVTARSEIAGAESAIEAQHATIQRIQADINDSALKAPRDGRVQYRVSEPGEVLGAGGRVLNLVDLSDVYMTFFLPTAQVGRVALGSEVRLVLDAAPQFVIPARATFVADVAQFTPKTVETRIEREKLMFRIKAHIPPELLREHIKYVKTGLPGVAYVLLAPAVERPDKLAVRLPPSTYTMRQLTRRRLSLQWWRRCATSRCTMARPEPWMRSASTCQPGAWSASSGRTASANRACLRWWPERTRCRQARSRC
jgi:HlyD family secretion protein